MCSGFVEGWCD